MKDQLPTNYVLIDFENVHLKNLEILQNHPFKIYVFVGANQTKIPFDLASTMQAFGENAKYIKICGNGKDSLDFHIAYYVGQLSSRDPNGYFHIVSKDTGFDPLIKHLRAKKIRILREKDLAGIPLLRISSATSSDEKIEAIVKNLAGRGQSRPRKIKTLANTINSLFTKKLDEKELMTLITKLEEQKHIAINQGNVTYRISKQPEQK